MLMALLLSAGALPAYATVQQKDEKAKEEKEKPKDEKDKKEAAKPQPQGPPPEWQAFFKANGIADPQKKIEALEKILKDFPKAEDFFVNQINQSILSATVKAWPDQKEKILTQARKIADKAPENSKGNTLNSVATIFLDAGVMLDDAQGFAEKGLASLDEKKFIEDRKKTVEKANEKADEKAKRPVPSDEELSKSFRSIRASNLSVLGRIHLKKGNTAEAEKYLKESYDANPTITATAVALAEISEKAGDDRAALDYLATAVLSGRVSKANREKFEKLYRKTHNNSLDGMEAMLDERYKKAFPPPIHPDDYKPTQARSKRVVLAEVFTGSGCPPCVSADLGFDAVMERYTREEVAVIMYHQHIPMPDPMTNTTTVNRFKFYSGGGVPTYVIDGEKSGGGGPRDATRQFYDRVNPVIEKQLEVAAQADLRLEAAMDGPVVKVKAVVENVKGSEGPVRLHIALVEDLIRYSGENGIRFHPMIVRAMAGQDTLGLVVDTAKPGVFEHTFDIPKMVAEIKTHLDDFEAKRNANVKDESKKFAFSEKKHEIDSNKLSVVAFLQDEKSKKILQAVYIKLKPGDVASSR